MKFFLTFFSLLSLLPITVHAALFNAESIQLDNGLQIIAIPNHRAPIVHHMLWYKAGAAQEITGHSGVAHFLEHLLFKGTNHPERPLAAGEFSKHIQKLGGRDNAFTSNDATVFHQTVSKKHLKTVMQMEADRMRHAIPPEEHVLSERDVIIEERNQRTDNNPHARFYEQMRSALFSEHPYGRPIIGWSKEIQAMNSTDTKNFYNRWYHPNNAILVITGDVTLDEILPNIQSIYGVIPKGTDIPIRHFPVIPDFEGKTVVTQHESQIKQPQWTRGYRVPSFHKNKEDALALQVLENILDGGATTRLYKKLTVEKKKAINVSLSYSPNNYGTASLWISATPAEGTSLQELETEIDALLTDLIAHGVTDQEISEAKTRLKNSAIFARDSLSTPAQIIGQALVTGSNLKDIETWDIQIDSVTKDQIQNVSNRYLKTGEQETYNYVTGYLLPKEETQK